MTDSTGTLLGTLGLENDETVLTLHTFAQNHVATTSYTICVVKEDNPTPAAPLNTKLLDYVIHYAQEQKESGSLKSVVQSVSERFESALANAAQIVTDAKGEIPTVTQEEVNSAAAELLEICHYLSFKVDKSQLHKLVDLVSKYTAQADTYIPSTYVVFEKMLTKANAVLADDETMEEDVDTAWNELAAAATGLRLKPNKDALKELLNRAKAVNLSLYTEGSITFLIIKISHGEKVLSSNESTQDDVDTAKAELLNTMENLDAIPTTSQAKAVNTTDKASNPKTGNATPWVFFVLFFSACTLLVWQKQRKY